jgi:glucose-6-phosphate 1-epimerase
VSQAGFEDTVVWNPGPDKARALRDFPDEDWLRMICIEAACVAAPVRLLPGEKWCGSQTLRLAR